MIPNVRQPPVQPADGANAKRSEKALPEPANETVSGLTSNSESAF
jgi:hypothetical protein